MQVLYLHDVSHEPERWFHLETIVPLAAYTSPGAASGKLSMDEAIAKAVHITNTVSTMCSNIPNNPPIVTEFIVRICEFGGAKITTRIIVEQDYKIILGKVRGATNGKILRFWGFSGPRDDLFIYHPYCLGMSCCPTYQFWDEWLTCGIVDGRVIKYVTDGLSDDFSVDTIDAISKWDRVTTSNYLAKPLTVLSNLNLNVSFLIDADGRANNDLNYDNDKDLRQFAFILFRLTANKRIDPIAVNAFHNSQIISNRLLSDLGIT